MRNYVGISEFKSEGKLYNLEVFDDEFFIILRNNKPVFIAYPNAVSLAFDKKFKFKSDCISVRDFMKNGITVEENTVLHLLKENKKYYNLIPFGREESNFIEKYLQDKIKEEHLNILKNNQ